MNGIPFDNSIFLFFYDSSRPETRNILDKSLKGKNVIYIATKVENCEIEIPDSDIPISTFHNYNLFKPFQQF